MQHLPSLTQNVLDALALQLCTFSSKSVVINFFHAGIQSYFCYIFPVYQCTVLHIAICGFGGDGKEGKSQFIVYVKLAVAVPGTKTRAVRENSL